MKSPSLSSDVRTLLHEKLDAMPDECDLVMDKADFGQVLDVLDLFLYVAPQNRLPIGENLLHFRGCKSSRIL